MGKCSRCGAKVEWLYPPDASLCRLCWLDDRALEEKSIPVALHVIEGLHCQKSLRSSPADMLR